jgi:hypothetical protein
MFNFFRKQEPQAPSQQESLSYYMRTGQVLEKTWDGTSGKWRNPSGNSEMCRCGQKHDQAACAADQRRQRIANRLANAERTAAERRVDAAYLATQQPAKPTSGRELIARSGSLSAGVQVYNQIGIAKVLGGIKSVVQKAWDSVPGPTLSLFPFGNGSERNKADTPPVEDWGTTRDAIDQSGAWTLAQKPNPPVDSRQGNNPEQMMNVRLENPSAATGRIVGHSGAALAAIKESMSAGGPQYNPQVFSQHSGNYGLAPGYHYPLGKR